MEEFLAHDVPEPYVCRSAGWPFFFLVHAGLFILVRAIVAIPGADLGRQAGKNAFRRQAAQTGNRQAGSGEADVREAVRPAAACIAEPGGGKAIQRDALAAGGAISRRTRAGRY